MKAQSSMEFIMLFSFVMIVFTLMIALLGEKYVSVQKERDYNALKELGERIKMEINLAYNTVEGYHRKVYLMDSIAGLEYNIRLDKSKDLNTK